VIDELNLPVCAAPESKPRRIPLATYDRWVNDNLRTLRDTQKRQQLDARASRRPVGSRFRIA
jgi:hypothetical protein